MSATRPRIRIILGTVFTRVSVPSDPAKSLYEQKCASTLNGFETAAANKKVYRLDFGVSIFHSVRRRRNSRDTAKNSVHGSCQPARMLEFRLFARNTRGRESSPSVYPPCMNKSNVAHRIPCLSSVLRVIRNTCQPRGCAFASEDRGRTERRRGTR